MNRPEKVSDTPFYSGRVSIIETGTRTFSFYLAQEVTTLPDNFSIAFTVSEFNELIAGNDYTGYKPLINGETFGVENSSVTPIIGGQFKVELLLARKSIVESN